MKKKEFALLASQLLPEMPGMTIHAPMVVSVPVGQILRGLYFEGSSFDAKSFFVWMFWLPLCVPTDEVYFNLGRRIRGESGGQWDAGSEQMLDELKAAVRGEALPFLHKVESLGGAIDAARQMAAESKDPYAQQALCYTLAKAGETEAAVKEIHVLLSLLNAAIPWQAEPAGRANLLRKKLTEKPEEANAMLVNWRAENIRRLGLEDLA